VITDKPTQAPWWQSAVFYQVYIRSFQDSNADGIGDLPGLISRLDYLRDLGIGAIWLSPHYPSPQVDCGYDIADYVTVAPEYGSLDDFRRLLDIAHQRGLHIITDLVLNHTSDQHAWFQESRSNRHHPRRDWYVWRPGRGDGPPNNWLSAFGGSSWEFDPSSGEYYYHLFFKEQPDLNWRNPAVKEAMWQVARFWLDLGVDGFRLDAIDTLYEHPDMPDHPVEVEIKELRHYLLSASSEQRGEHGSQKQLFQYQVDQPGDVELMQELRKLVNEYPERVLLGESDRIVFYGEGGDGLNMIFNFPLMNMKKLEPEQVSQNQQDRLTALPAGAWSANTLGNHDRPRTLQAHSDGKHNQELARLSLALVLTLRGTPFLYYGEEIGMNNLLLGDLAQVRDFTSLWVYHMALERGVAPQEALQQAVGYGRDQCRTPMQWENSPNAGFCPRDVHPWLPVNPDHNQGVNVADQKQDPGSLLNFYRNLLRLRRETPALSLGEYQTVGECPKELLAYLREIKAPRQVCLVLLNFSDCILELSYPQLSPTMCCLFSTNHPRGVDCSTMAITLAPFEVFIGEIKLNDPSNTHAGGKTR
jgi:alpha-glucosidase